MRLIDLSAQEHQYVVEAEETYGNFYQFAQAVTSLMSTFVGTSDTPPEIFLRFMTQVKKAHTLAFFSFVRRHGFQGQLDMRYFMESAVNAAYALQHRDTALYMENDIPVKTQTVSNRANNWIAAAYPSESEAIKTHKDLINERIAHANVASSHKNFAVISDRIEAPYFDIADVDGTKVNLFMCGKMGLMVIGLILNENAKHPVFAHGKNVQLYDVLTKNCDELLAQLTAIPRFSAALEAES